MAKLDDSIVTHVSIAESQQEDNGLSEATTGVRDGRL